MTMHGGDALSAGALSDDEFFDGLTEEERTYLASEVDGVLATFEGALGAEDLAFMRAALIESAQDARRNELVRAATPRLVDESGAVVRRPAAAPPKKLATGR